PDVGGDRGPYRQSERGAIYDDALRRLARERRLFPCRVSRSELRELTGSSSDHGGLPPYPARLRPTTLEDGWLDDLESRQARGANDAALRFQVEPGPVAFQDAVVGVVLEDVAETVGDFVLRRRDGVYAYQLAVVVDDIAMGVTEVVRGMDLLDSTARQIQLIHALEGDVPTYAHLPLAVGADGEKLAKRHGDTSVRSLRQAGVSPAALVGWLAGALGQGDTPRTPLEVAASFRIEDVRPDPVTVPPDLERILLDRS
ncbi:glutamate--tRNA ligase family protein, partial [Rubrivirga sp.]|uniref:glutamate--tRNA ligase family protein n=1 Tax=Rubrivirga sp. TaxID=1885344 RepID=UPI003C7224CD